MTHRWLTLGAGLALLAGGAYTAAGVNVDVFPDLNRPVVTVLAEAPGLAAEEVETLVTRPLEAALIGAPGVHRVRSQSRRGLVMVRAEFAWGSDIYRCRQVVNERLDGVTDDLPTGVRPLLGPISSIMGEIQLIGVTAAPAKDSGTESGVGASQPEVSPVELRSFAQWHLRRRLLAIPGISSVTVLGGRSREYRIALKSDRLERVNATLPELKQALAGIGRAAGGGFFARDGQEWAIRPITAPYIIEEIGQAVVARRGGRPVSAADIAEIREDYAYPRGDGGVNGETGVIVAVQKQPGADTLALTAAVEAEIARLAKNAGDRFAIQPGLFRQADFIERSIENVQEAIRDGSLIVVVVLFLFLWNLRTTGIVLAALPLSLLAGMLVLLAGGYGINTLTLGGLAIAIGELVDDAIVDTENIFRRLRENAKRAEPWPVLRVVFEASREIRNSIVLATAVVCAVFLPLFFLEGIEGRLFRPLAVAYIVALGASLVVALTITPVLCSLLLPGLSGDREESWLVRRLKVYQQKNLEYLLDRPFVPVAVLGGFFALALAALPFLPREFLPEFNEGTLTLEVITPAGTSLERSVERARRIEARLLDTKGVVRISRRTGRAEQDEHAEGVHYSEMDVTIDPGAAGLSRADLLGVIRGKLAGIQDAAVNIGQPISHRLDHLLSGTRAGAAILIYGYDFEALVAEAYRAKELVASVAGTSDVLVETQAEAPELKVALDYARAREMGLPVALVNETLEIALSGAVVGRILEEDRIIPVRLVLADEDREPARLGRLVLDHLPDGRPVRLQAVADIYESRGPYEIKREDGVRRIAVQFNIPDGDPEGVMQAVEAKLAAELQLNSGHSWRAGGRLVGRARALRTMGLLGAAALAGILALVYWSFRSWTITAQIFLNLPLAFIGGVFALFVTGTSLSLASVVGFVALAGIASRNGILMISHFRHLIRSEGESFSRAMIVRGARERLIPVLMTASTAIFALAPVILSGSEAPGKEILFPVALVISGGLVSSTLLDVILTPVLFYAIQRRTGAAGVAHED